MCGWRSATCKLLSVYGGSNKWYLHVDGLVSFARYRGCLVARVVVCVIRTLCLHLNKYRVVRHLGVLCVRRHVARCL